MNEIKWLLVLFVFVSFLMVFDALFGDGETDAEPIFKNTASHWEKPCDEYANENIDWVPVRCFSHFGINAQMNK